MPRVSRTSPKRPVQCVGALIRLEDESSTDADADRGVWVQVAREGQFAGYRGGSQPFSFTRDTFEELVRNVRAHPSYQAGPEGHGIIGIVPWDFNHASEQDPTGGALPIGGAPAQGWTMDLEIRAGKDGRAELWALTTWLEPARTYIRGGQYKWASVAVAFNSIDPVSGENVGAVLTSIAMTNQPFIEGMQQLAASRFFHVEPAGSASDALDMIRELLAIPTTAGISEVMSEIAKLEQWVTVGNAPVGVDLSEIVANLRRILNLPALSEATRVVGEATRILEGMIQEQAANEGSPALPHDEVPPTDEMMVSTAKENEMDLKILASKFGVRDSDVEDAVDDAVALRSKLKTLLKSKKGTNEVLLQDVEEVIEETEEATSALNTILQTLGVTDPASALAALPTLMEAKDKLEQMVAELETAIGMNVDSEIGVAEEEIQQTMATRGWKDEGITFALRQLRGLNFSEDADNRTKLASLKKGREVFAEKYPKPKGGNPALLKSHVATKDGRQLAVSKDGAGVKLAKSEMPGAKFVSLAGYPGRNTTERVMAWVRGNIEGADKWAREEVFTTACEMKQKIEFEDPDLAVGTE